MKLKLFILLWLWFFSGYLYSKPLTVKEFFSMTTSATVLPTMLPSYTSVMHNAPHPYAKRKRFIKENFESLKDEIAKGEGEHLDTLATLYSIDDVERWKHYLQTHFEEIFGEEKSVEAVSIYINKVTYDDFIDNK